MKNILVAASAIIVLASCGGGSSEGLTAKREALAKKQEELTKLKSEIVQLENEIAALDTTARDNAIPVRTTTIKADKFQNPFQIQGLVESEQNVLVSPEVPANLTSVHVKEGQYVTKGQVIASLDGSVAASQIAELENALALAKLNYEKQERLWNNKVGSEMQYLQAKNQYENLKKNLETANTQLGKYTLRAPISGTIDAIMANPGELVGGMTSGPVARIVNMRDIKIKASVSERYVADVKKGQPVKVYLPSLGLTLEEKIAAVSNVIDVNNRTFSVYIKPSSHQDVLKPNLLALVTAYDYVKEEAISIPTRLVRTEGDKHFVFTIAQEGNKNIVEKRYIEIEKQFPSETVIASGISDGDQLITEGVSSVIVGDEVKIISE